MKCRIFAGVVMVCWCFGVLPFECATNAQQGMPTPILKGIISWPGTGLALLENTNARSEFLRYFILGPGQRDGDIEVTELHSGSVKVRLAPSAQELELSFPASAPDSAAHPNEAQNPYFVRFEKIGVGQVLSMYQKIAGRTLLRSSRIPRFEVTIAPTNATSKFALLKILETALAEQGVMIQPHRDKFALAATGAADFEKVKPELWDTIAALSPEDNAVNPSHEKGAGEIPPGMINFPEVDLAQALVVYQELLGMTIVRRSIVPTSLFSLRTETALTRTEAKYAFAATLALDDMSLLPAGDKFVLLFMSWDRQQISNMLARIKLRSVSTNSPIAAGTIKFPGTRLDEVAPVYEHLLGQKVEIAASTPVPVLFFGNQSALSKEEALYGLELLFGVNGLAVVPEGGAGVKIVPAGEVGPDGQMRPKGLKGLKGRELPSD